MNVKHIAKAEPVLSAAGISAAVSALIALLVAFGVDLTEAQSVAILGVVAVLAPAAVALVRKYVSPSAGVVPKRDVVEYEIDGHVLAGEANELPTNTHVREAGDLDEGL